MNIYVRIWAVIQYYRNKDILKRDLFKRIGQNGPAPFVSWPSTEIMGGAKRLDVMYTCNTKMLKSIRKTFSRDNYRENVDIPPCSRGLAPLFLI